MILKWVEGWLTPKVAVITNTRYFQAEVLCTDAVNNHWYGIHVDY